MLSSGEYAEFERQLKAVDVDLGISEIHGLLCGLLCGNRKDARNLWEEDLFSGCDRQDLLVSECMNSVYDLYERTSEAIVGPGLGFSLVLPADNQPLRQRAEALVGWARGFLYGLGLGSVDENALADEVTELMRDFGEITRMDVDRMPMDEESEEAYTELVEFLWVGAMLIYAGLTVREEAAKP